MKKFVIPVILAAIAALLLGGAAVVYPAVHAPDVMQERPAVWEGEDGSWLRMEEDGAVVGQLPLRTGERVDFFLGWREAYGEAFADEDCQELLFTTGLRAWGDRLTFRIETDRVGLTAEQYGFRRTE